MDEIKRCDSSRKGDTFMNRIQSLCAVVKRGHHVAVLFGVILALATFASAADMHKGKKGSLKITAPTEVGGVVLQPGDYEVQEIHSTSGPVVKFTHLFNNFTAQEGLPVYDQEVVAEVKVTEQELSGLPKHTQLMLASKTADATGLEIRGNAVGYQFGPSPMNDRVDSEMSCTNNGPQQ
jgi:hypothetical protein